MAVVVKTTSPVRDVTEGIAVKSDALEINVNPYSAQRQTDRNTSFDGLCTIHHIDDEVLGIITMEDVLEELLQVILP